MAVKIFFKHIQAHRRVLGLLCFARVENENEVSGLKKLYEELKHQYNGTVFDSRLIVFGINKNQQDSEGASSSTEPR